MKRSLGLVAAVLAGSLTVPAQAAPGSGSLDDPLVVDDFPYALAHSTAAAPSQQIDSYSCAPSVDESGPERVFIFTLAAPAKVTAWVQGDGGGVDIDVHLLDDGDVQAGQATNCSARGNEIAEAQMSAGSHYVVVDSYGGAAQAGPFVLHLEAIGDSWNDRIVAEGVRWRARRFSNLDGAQAVHELLVDTSVAGVQIHALRSGGSGCQTVDVLGTAAGAVAGINGGYFDMGGGSCAPVSLLKHEGNLLGTNSVDRGAFGLTATLTPLVQQVAASQDWPVASEAHGGGPILVVGGIAKAGADAWAQESFSGGFIEDNPRTMAGYDDSGRIHLVTVDGRHDHADGMSLDELAALAAGDHLQLTDAVNLDGGGSTTMWIAGATPDGVVNYPSDGGSEQADRPNARPCSGGFFVFAPAYNHPPRFQTTPLTSAAVGDAYSYDADAIDLDVSDTISFSLLTAPVGMSIDSVSGKVSFSPTATAPAIAQVTIVAADNRGAESSQSFQLAIAGGQGAAGSGGAGSSAGGSGAQQQAAGGSEPVGHEDQGIPGTNTGGCRASRPVPGRAWYWPLGLCAIALWRLRKTRLR